MESYKGILSWKGNKYKYIYKTKDINKSINIENQTCLIKGEFSLNNTSQPFIFIRQVDLSSCQSNKSLSFINKYQSYIHDQMQQSHSIYFDRILGLISGDTSSLNPMFIEDVKEIGIYHLLAVSGSHVAAIIYLIYQIFVRFNTPIIIIKSILLILLPLYALYTDFAPSAVRAILAAIILLLLPKSLKINPLELLSIVFILMFFINPQIVYDIGFQFSFLISLFLMISSPLLKQLSGLKLIVAVTFIAQLGALLISIYHFNQIQWIGLISNLVFVPFYSFFIFPLAILFYVLSHFTIHLSILNANISVIFKLHDCLVSIFLKLKYLRVFVPDLSTISLILIMIFTFLSLFLFVKKYFFKAIFIICMGISLIIYYSSGTEGQLTMLDVGQGDSILFQTESKQNIMIDTGGKRSENHKQPNFNISKYKTMPSLKSKGISKIDYLIISHPHLDHMGELPYLASHINIKNIILLKDSFSQSDLYNVEKICEANHIKLLDANHLHTLNLKDTTLRFLDTYIKDSDDKNEHSIVILLSYKHKNILLTGDMTIQNEALLLQRYQLPKIDILKVAHHGSKTSSSSNLLQLIKPEISLISSGRGNKYQLPNQEVIQRLYENGSKVYDTQMNGEITVKLNSILTITTKQSN
ncbi:DNA internalization-related competence protein ComEC/Rec2 [Staphylococcus sp. HL28]|uniref:DNA internalization-related competence protein ComEC/Rec2 n=1 Tax=Staphylococcus sp. HL28 TaxID=2897335 RepID=UPI001E3DDDB8|nr:DNA internalization-related competence protein ComEC/Rec2 [Staphylococcus sp. HL28]UGB07300.1 DNA internalization-related competence protein ComEC/Rec2 [Staphylococcus sp. HL28]